MFDFQDELKVCLVLLGINLLRVLAQGQVGPVAAACRSVGPVLSGALRQIGSNPFLALFFWIVLAQAAGWLGVLMTFGWGELMRFQTGQR